MSHVYHFFSEKNLIPDTPEQINLKLLAGIDIAAQRKEIDRPFYSNMVHFEVRDPSTQPFRDKIIALHEALELEELKEESALFIELLNNEKLEDLHKLLEDKKHDKDLVAHIEKNKLFSTLQNCSNEALTVFTREIRERYAHVSVKVFFPNDYGSLNELLNSIKGHLAKGELPILRKFLWEELADILKKTCEVFETEE